MGRVVLMLRSRHRSAGVERTVDGSSRMADGAVIEATGPSLPILFDEIGMALVNLTAEFDAGAPTSSWESVELEAPDLAGLAGTWLNALMREAAERHAELVDVAVDTVTAPAPGTGHGWRLHGRVGLRRLLGRHGPARRDLRATTGPHIETTAGRWTLQAQLEVDRSVVDDNPRPQAGDASPLARSSATWTTSVSSL